MSGRDEHEPDPAALDELSRAFGTETEGVRIVPRTPTPPRPETPDASDSLDDDGLEPTAPTPIQGRPSQPDTEPATQPSAPAVIAIGGDDDFPDPVYVEGSLDAGSRRGPVVVIEDDESGDALRTETARDLRRGVEPRMRERRAAVHRAKIRKRLVWIGLVVGVALVLVAALAVLGSGLFAVQEDQVRITGNVYTDPEALQVVVDDLVGTPTLLADTDEAERRLEQIPWVEAARVRVSFPRSASIEIRERKALTTYQGPDQRFRVLDRQGRVLDVLDQYPIAYLLIRGPDPVDLEPGQFAPFGYVAASELAMSLTPSLRGQVTSVGVTADGAAMALLLDNGIEVHFGEARNLLDKLVRVETVLADIAAVAAEAAAAGRPEAELPAVIDVSTRETTR
ncbi:MAG TPA: FtsQ-type POTRA domain-containing protein [Ilumatobacter sp.]|nr:FtsQ-type POTRA domain-containing protein [Ilumatobacter sp.]